MYVTFWMHETAWFAEIVSRMASQAVFGMSTIAGITGRPPALQVHGVGAGA
jgi:hypothetical protein